MNSKVHYLKEATRESNESVIALLKELLQLAEAGELRAIGVIGELTTSRILTDCAGDMDVVRMVGGCALLQTAIMDLIGELNE